MVALTDNQIPAPKLPELYPEQHAALYDPRRWTVIEASTKAGKTMGCAVWIVQRAWNGPKGTRYAWMSYTHDRSVDPGLKSVRHLLEQWDPNQQHWFHYRQKRMIELRPGGRHHAEIYFFGAEDPDAIYGPEYNGAVVDEASRCSEQAWHALRSTLTTYSAPARIIGNVKGRGNWMYKMGQRGRSDDPANADVGYHKITALVSNKYAVDKPGGFLPITDKELEDARNSYPDPVFRELYMAEPSDTVNGFFSSKAVNAIRSLCYEPTRYSYDCLARCLAYDPSGPWRVWRKSPGLPAAMRLITPDGKRDPQYQPSRQSDNFAFGVDLGYGNGQSNSVIAVIDLERSEVVAEFASPTYTPHDLAKQACDVGRNVFIEPLVCWETNGPGEGWHRALAQYGGVSIYRERREGTKGERKTRRYGWRSTRAKKHDRLMNLHREMATGGVKIHSEQFLDEAERYTLYDDDQVGPDTQADMNTGARAAHGDRVIAYMLATVAARGNTGATGRSFRVYTGGSRDKEWQGLLEREADRSYLQHVFSSDLEDGTY